MDVIWTAEFANAGWISRSLRPLAKQVTKNVFPSVVKTASFEGKLYGAPFNSNTQLLWYRKDLVPKPPTTWDPDDRPGREARVRGKAGHDPGAGQQVRGLHGLGQRADRLRGRPDPLGPGDGRPAAEADGRGARGDGPPRALAGRGHRTSPPRPRTPRGSASSRATPPSWSTTRSPTGARWRTPRTSPRTWASPSTRGSCPSPSKPPLGGFNLGVGAYSNNPDLAFQAAACLSNAKSELTATELDGLPPSRSNLYTNKVVRRPIRASPRWSSTRSSRRARGR